MKLLLHNKSQGLNEKYDNPGSGKFKHKWAEGLSPEDETWSWL